MTPPAKYVIESAANCRDVLIIKAQRLNETKALPRYCSVIPHSHGGGLAFPQFCGEMSSSFFGFSSMAVAAERLPAGTASPSILSGVTQKAESTLPGVPSNDSEMPKDEDCFCCCAHVMPSPLFVDPETSQLVLLYDIQAPASIPTGSVHTPYHPPRSA